MHVNDQVLLSLMPLERVSNASHLLKIRLKFWYWKWCFLGLIEALNIHQLQVQLDNRRDKLLLLFVLLKLMLLLLKLMLLLLGG